MLLQRPPFLLGQSSVRASVGDSIRPPSATAGEPVHRISSSSHSTSTIDRAPPAIVEEIAGGGKNKIVDGSLNRWMNGVLAHKSEGNKAQKFTVSTNESKAQGTAFCFTRALPTWYRHWWGRAGTH